MLSLSSSRGFPFAHWVPLVLAMLLAGAVLPQGTAAQRVERGPVTGYSSRRWTRAASEQGRADWPDLANGETGTQVRIRFHPETVDADVATNLAYGLDPLLQACRTLAARLGLPQTDFITVQGRTTVLVDMEFNDYMRRERFRRGFDLNLGGLAAALQGSQLPRPIVIAIDPDDCTRATLTFNGRPEPLTGMRFFGPSEIPSTAALHYEAALTWTGIPGLLFFVLMMFGAPVFLLVSALRHKPEPAPAQPGAPDPEEVQQRYDRQRPAWASMLGFLLFPAVFLVLKLDQAMLAAQLLLPFPFSWLMYGMFGLMAVTMPLSFWLMRRRQREAEKAEEPVTREKREEDNPPAWATQGWLWVMGGTMLLLAPSVLIPAYSVEAALWKRNIVFTLIGLSVLSSVVIGFLGWRASRRVLKGGPWYDAVHELAAATGVRVRNVVMVRSASPNAFASALGSVGLTTSLAREFEPEEARTILAHEIGHLKHRHPQRTLFLSLVVVALFIAAQYGLTRLLEGRLSPEVRILFNGPITAIILMNVIRMLFLGRGLRHREHQADQVAVELTGDPELYIHALTKIHTLNASPSRLKRSDEVLSTHPSLVRRIEAIREEYPAAPEPATG